MVGSNLLCAPATRATLMHRSGVIVRFPLGDGDPAASMEGWVDYLYLGAARVFVRRYISVLFAILGK